MQRRPLIAAGALLPLVAAAQAAAEAEWNDAARSRRVPLLMRWPAGSGPTEPTTPPSVATGSSASPRAAGP